jgi:hypothetical protein
VTGQQSTPKAANFGLAELATKHILPQHLPLPSLGSRRQEVLWRQWGQWTLHTLHLQASHLLFYSERPRMMGWEGSREEGMEKERVR